MEWLTDADVAERLTGRLNTIITDRPWQVVTLFFVVTLVMFGGVVFIEDAESESGTDDFTEDLDEQEALDQMNEDFAESGQSTGGTTALLYIEDARNVLSQESLLRMLELQKRVENDDQLRVSSSTSVGSIVAQQLDPAADEPDDQYRAIERATQRELEAAIVAADQTADLSVSTDFTPESASADVAIVTFTYDTPPNADSGQIADLQRGTEQRADQIDGYDLDENVAMFGPEGLLQEEIEQLIFDTIKLVFPAALFLIALFLIVAYRDPVDLVMGVVTLLILMIWTVGFMRFAGIPTWPLSQTLIAVFPMLLAVGIDFGIHIINRYREERVAGESIGDAMGVTVNQLTIAFVIVTLTSVFSFIGNLTSDLASLRNFGLVASVGIFFTYLLFGVFLPSAKVILDRFREGRPIPAFGTSPMGSDGSSLGAVLAVGTKLARTIPVVLLVSSLIFGAAAGSYGTGVETEFALEDFFPEDERIERFQVFGPLAPNEYRFTTTIGYLKNDFDSTFIESITIFIEGNEVRSASALQDIDRAQQNPPPEFKSDGRQAVADSIVTVIRAQAADDPEFAATVDQYDTTGDGLPNREVDHVYDELLETERGDEASQYLADDRGSTRIEFEIEANTNEANGSDAAWEIAEDMHLDATPTGGLVVNNAVNRLTREASFNGLVIAFILTAILLVIAYLILEGRAVYGVINLVPILITVGALAGSMRLLEIPLTAFNAPILAVSIGVGIDYNVHFMHRFVDEYKANEDVHEALAITARGTGGALTGSMLTTVFGLGVLYLSILGPIAEFGILLALGVFYAYAASLLILPSTIVVWDRLETRHGRPAEVWDRVRSRG